MAEKTTTQVALDAANQDNERRSVRRHDELVAALGKSDDLVLEYNDSEYLWPETLITWSGCDRNVEVIYVAPGVVLLQENGDCRHARRSFVWVNNNEWQRIVIKTVRRWLSPRRRHEPE